MPTRYLKPGVRDSEAIDSLSPLAEVLFYRLLVTVDDFGRYDGRAAMIKAHCFPIKDMPVAKCAALLQELHDRGLVVLYTVDDKPYVQMCKWDNVPRAKESKHPAPDVDAMHLHTYASKPRAVLPLTETVTGTETETVNQNKDTAPRKRSASTPKISKPIDVDEQVWSDFLTIRKAKGAPLTATALAGIERESAKAGMTLQAALETCCARGWQGFKAEWIQREVTSATATRQGAVAMPMTFKERDEALARKRWEEMTGQKWPDEQDARTIDITPTGTELFYEPTPESN
ncbi:MAG: hypothetical protein RL758_81 [Pseudomonadota bacterium]|jgi:hypothetical protein